MQFLVMFVTAVYGPSTNNYNDTLYYKLEENV